MGTIVDTNGYLASNDGTPLVVEIQHKRDNLLAFTFYDPVTLGAKSVAGATITVTFRERPLASEILLQKTMTVTGGTGQATLAVADTDFPGIDFDLGQRFRHLFFDVDILLGGNHYAVRDGGGAAVFACVVWQSVFGVPN